MKGLLYFLGGATLGVGGAWLVMGGWKKLVAKAALGAGEGFDTAAALGIHMRQIRRYAFAASQDLSPVVGITHASYALVLLDTLEEIAGRENLAKTGVDPSKLRKFITSLQDKHAERLQRCDPHLQSVLAIERAEGGQIPNFVVAGAAPRGA